MIPTTLPEGERVYLSVGARFIQRWLTSTPRLRLMRGASELLGGRPKLALGAETSALDSGSSASAPPDPPTSPGAIRRWCSDESIPATLVTDAGDVSGVVVLAVTEPARLDEVAERLLSYLTDRIPSASWDVWARRADSFFNARKAQDDWSSGELAAPPLLEYVVAEPPVEIGMLSTCPGCGIEVSCTDGIEDRRDPHTADDPYGLACSTKYHTWDVSRRSRKSHEPHDLTELAQRGGLCATRSDPNTIGKGRSRTHLAMICADVNNGGAFFADLATRINGGELETEALAEASAAMKSALRAATEKAVGARAQGGTPKIAPAEVHFLGGDDLLLSTPAIYGWRIAADLVKFFRDSIEVNLAAAGLDCPLALELGLGIVFANATYPVAAKQRHAERAMNDAKAASKRPGADGTAKPHLGFCDLTVDENAAPYVVACETVQRDLINPPTGAMAMKGSARNRVFAMTGLDDLGAVDRARKINRESQRNDWGLPTLDDTSKALDDPCVRPAEESLKDLRADLVRARWWPVVAPVAGRDMP